jgi:hypothetical protein
MSGAYSTLRKRENSRWTMQGEQVKIVRKDFILLRKKGLKRLKNIHLKEYFF